MEIAIKFESKAGVDRYLELLQTDTEIVYTKMRDSISQRLSLLEEEIKTDGEVIVLYFYDTGRPEIRIIMGQRPFGIK